LRRSLIALAWFAVLFVRSASAWQLEDIPAPGIHVPVWAARGETLTAGTLSASINGAPARILSIKSPEDELMLLVVLDLTDDLAAVEQARRALTARLDKLPSNYFVGVLLAQNGLRVVAEPTTDRTVAAAAISSHTVGGRAGLLETIEPAAQIGTSVISASGVRLAVLYLTDSDIGNYREAFTNPVVNSSDNGDLSRRFSDVLVRERISTIATKLAETGVPIFISQLTYRTDQLNVAYQTGLIALAGATGGSATISRSVSEIPSAIDELLDRIVGHYSVKLAVPDPKKKINVILRTPQGNALIYRSNFVLGGP
jgi:hypothetical protein